MICVSSMEGSQKAMPPRMIKDQQKNTKNGPAAPVSQSANVSTLLKHLMTNAEHPRSALISRVGLVWLDAGEQGAMLLMMVTILMPITKHEHRCRVVETPRSVVQSRHTNSKYDGFTTTLQSRSPEQEVGILVSMSYYFTSYIAGLHIHGHTIVLDSSVSTN